jgi:serine/threonine protein kinase
VPGLDAHGPSGAGPDVVVPGAPLVPGRVLGARYELIRPIARGGMAEVWEGHDATLRRPVAVKILLTHLASDSKFVERFRREAVTSARVGHPCVVATYDAGVDAGTAFIVMELVQGQTLRQLLTASAPLDPGLAVAIALQIADALANAHRVGLVHRDIKPGNVLLCDDGSGSLRVKVTDFGIAKVGAELGADLTQTGMVLGTPKYLSPEQVEGRVDPDARSDLYALGVVLFEMLTGRTPFKGPTEMATALSHLREAPPRVSALRPGISAGLDSFVAGLLAKSPADRPPTAVAARQALDVLARQGATAHSSASGHRPPPGGRPVDPDARPTSIGGAVGNEAWGPNGATRTNGIPRTGGDRATPPGGRPVPRSGRTAGPGGGSVPGDAGSPGSAVFPGSAGFRGGTGYSGGAASPGGAGYSGGAASPGGAGPGSRVGSGDAAGRSPSGARAVAPPAGSAKRPEPARRPRRRNSRVPGALVAILALAAVIAAGILIADHGGAGSGVANSGRGSTAALPIQAVTVWMDASAKGHTPDNPAETGNVFDGKASTLWQTDPYLGRSAATFGGYYDGEGLAIHLRSGQTLARLVVSSPSSGWAASTYVAASEPPSFSSLSGWGRATDSHRDIASGTTTFALSGRRGQWILLWLTYLGPAHQVGISEVAAH